jgi:hypothetical protein
MKTPPSIRYAIQPPVKRRANLNRKRHTELKKIAAEAAFWVVFTAPLAGVFWLLIKFSA